MAREYRIIHPEPGFIQKVYNEQGVSWGQAKKALRQEYLEMARELRQLREKDAVVYNPPEVVENIN